MSRAVKAPPRKAAIAFGFSYEWNSGDNLGHDGVTPITVDLPPGTTAVSVDLLGGCGAGPSNVVWTVSISTGEAVVVNSLPRPDRAFAGFTSEVSITSMTLSASGEAFPLPDNFVFGQASITASQNSVDAVESKLDNDLDTNVSSR